MSQDAECILPANFGMFLTRTGGRSCLLMHLPLFAAKPYSAADRSLFPYEWVWSVPDSFLKPMKKILCLLSILAASLFFLSGLQQTRMLQQMNYSYPSRNFSKQMNVPSLQLFVQTANEEDYEQAVSELETLADQFSVSLFCAAIPAGTRSSQMTKWLVRLADDAKLDTIFTAEKLPEDFFRQENGFLSSSQENSERAYTLDFTDPSLHEGYQEEYIIQPVGSIPSKEETISSNSIFSVVLAGANAAQMAEALQENGVRFQIAATNEDPALSKGLMLFTGYFGWLLLLCLASFVLCLGAFILKERKQAGLRLLHGQSIWRTTSAICLPVLLACLLSFLAALIILYALVVQKIRPVDFPFLRFLLSAFGLFALAAAGAFAAGAAVFASIRKSTVLKGEKKRDNLWIAGAVLQTAVIIAMIAPARLYWDQMISALSYNAVLNRYSDSFTGYLVNDYIPDDSFESLTAFMHENGFAYCAFDRQMTGRNGTPAVFGYELADDQSQLFVSSEYFQSQPAADPQGNLMKLPSDTNYVLVPEDFRQAFDAGVQESQIPEDFQILTIQSGQSFAAHFPQPDCVRTNPLILVINDWSSDPKSGLPLSSASGDFAVPDTPAIRKALDTFQQQHQIQLSWSPNAAYTNIVMQKNQSEALLSALVLLFLMLILWIFQSLSLFLFYYEKGKSTALQFLLGKTLPKRCRKLFVLSAIKILIVLAGGWIASKSLLFTLSVTLFVLVSDAVIFFAMNRRFEKTQIVSVMKGDGE